MSFKNAQGITDFEINGEVKCFCPLGKSWYTTDISIQVSNPENIPDYCDITTEIKSLDGTTAIIEDIVTQIWDIVKKQVGNCSYLTIVSSVNNAAHFPVIVKKEFSYE